MTGVGVWLARHGQTEWSATGRHTSWTELPLTKGGEQEALAVGHLLRTQRFDLVLSSPRERALRTAELAGFEPQIDDDLVEWDYGDLEGLTTDQIQARYPGWSLWSGPWPRGETPDHVAKRADTVITRVLVSPQVPRCCSSLTGTCSGSWPLVGSASPRAQESFSGSSQVRSACSGGSTGIR